MIQNHASQLGMNTVGYLEAVGVDVKEIRESDRAVKRRDMGAKGKWPPYCK